MHAQLERRGRERIKVQQHGPVAQVQSAVVVVYHTIVLLAAQVAEAMMVSS